MRRLSLEITICLPLLAVFGCPPVQTSPADDELTLEELMQEYRAAVQDAATAEAGEISRDLTAITADNLDLIWSGEPGNSMVLMVTWTSWTGYDSAVGYPLQLTQEVWVTAAPQVRDFCLADGESGDDLNLRLEQLLGLPPNDGKTTFAQLWVDPADLFRPSRDPEITDHEAGLSFPEAAGYMSVTDAYIAWFDALLADSYGDDGYPWTQLGYTYDWGNDGSEIGLSEFIIRNGATVVVQGTFATQAYCTAVP